VPDRGTCRSERCLDQPAVRALLQPIYKSVGAYASYIPPAAWFILQQISADRRIG
jgi:hypothetical protein